jgi:plasmid maintenance system killer protein
LLSRPANASPPPCERRSSNSSNFSEKNRRHPSLRAKKFEEGRNYWQARVNREWRFYFAIENDTYHILKLTPHPK